MLAHSTMLVSTAAAGNGRQRRGVGSRRAYDGIDNAAMGIQLSLNDPYKTRRSGDFTDQQQQQQQQPQLYADYRRRSLTADSDATSIGRGRGGAGLPSTTPVGSYINGVLGGSLHPGLADDLDSEAANEGGSGMAAAAAAGPDEDAKSAAESAGEAVVRLRAENARLAERLRGVEQRARQADRERQELAEKAAALAGELDEAREELRAEQRLTAGLRRQRDSERAGRAENAEPLSPPASRPGSSLDAELELANQRASSLERSLQEMQRRLMLAEGPQAADSATGAAAADENLEAPSSAGPAAALAVGAMSQAVADLRADAEALRRRAARDELARKHRLEEAEERAADGQRASDEALLSVSLGLQSAKTQNAQLRRLLERSESERAGQGRRLGKLQEDFGQLQESQSGLEAWASQVAAGREDLRQLGEANGELRERLSGLERSLTGLSAELQAARSEAARRSERCRRLAEEAKRARQAEEKSSRTAAAVAAALGRAGAENQTVRRRLGAAAEAAEAARAPHVARQLRELAETLRTDFQVASSESDSGLGDTAEPRRRSNAQLAALIEQIDLVGARGDSLLALKRRQMQEAAEAGAPSQSHQKQQRSMPDSGPPAPLLQAAHEDRGDMQRLLRMLLYNSGGFAASR